MPSVGDLAEFVVRLSRFDTIQLAELCLAELSSEERVSVVMRAFGGDGEHAFELDELILRAQEKLDRLEAEAKKEGDK